MTAVFLFSPDATSAGPTCSSVFSENQGEFSRLDILSEFLNEDPGTNFSKRFTVAKTEPPQSNIAEYYTTEMGHPIINSIVWTKDYSNRKAKLVKDLSNYLAGGRHKQITTYAGTTFSKADFQRIQPLKKYSPQYFFSTSKDPSIANNFLENMGNHNSPSSHVKVYFEITGKSGRDISKTSKYNEEEILYPPDAEFIVSEISYLFRNANGFDTYRVYLKEEDLNPPKHTPHTTSITTRDLRRVESRKNYIEQKKNGNNNPLNIYPAEGIKSFENALVFVNQESKKNRDLSVELLKDIHRIALKDHFFEGYYRRRIRQEYLYGNISKQEALTQLANIHTQKDNTNQLLAGTFRNEKIDNYVMTGLDIDTNGHRSYTSSDLFSIATNPFFRIEAGSIKKNPKQFDKVDANVLFLPVEKIESTIKSLINQAREDLSLPQSDYEYTIKVLQLQQNLISIHPFHDGNGRAIKLLSDFLFLKRGLAPPLHANNDDYTLSINELYRQTVHEMNAYLTEK